MFSWDLIILKWLTHPKLRMIRLLGRCFKNLFFLSCVIFFIRLTVKHFPYRRLVKILICIYIRISIICTRGVLDCNNSCVCIKKSILAYMPIVIVLKLALYRHKCDIKTCAVGRTIVHRTGSVESFLRVDHAGLFCFASVLVFKHIILFPFIFEFWLFRRLLIPTTATSNAVS